MLDVIDFLYNEMRRVVENKRAPNYATSIQVFINKAFLLNIMSTYPVTNDTRVQLYAQTNIKKDPHSHGAAPPPPPSSAYAIGSGSARPHGKSPVEASVPQPPSKGRSFTYRAPKLMMSYVKDIHHHVFKASARSNKALCLINVECHHNGEKVPYGSEDECSHREEYVEVFFSDEEVNKPVEQDEDQSQAYGGFYEGGDDE